MKIIADEQGRDAIMKMADISLRHGGLSNFDGILGIINSIENYEEVMKKDKKEVVDVKEVK